MPPNLTFACATCLVSMEITFLKECNRNLHVDMKTEMREMNLVVDFRIARFTCFHVYVFLFQKSHMKKNVRWLNIHGIRKNLPSRFLVFDSGVSIIIIS